jgi:ABC-type nitrate/sulfonate/bicarbonate transport system permease component
VNGPVRRITGYLAATLLLLVAWQVLAWALARPVLPGPMVALADLWRLRSSLLGEAGVSAWRVTASILLGLSVGAPLGLAIGRSPKADAVFAPLIFLTYPIPKVVFLPVLFVLLGIGDAPKIALITLIVFFQILVTARDAARAIPAASVLSVRSLGADRWQVFRHVVVPAALPEIFTALRISAGTAIAVLFFSEAIAGSTGLGYYIVDAWGRVAYGEMFAGIVAMALLGVVLYELIEALELRLCRWTRAGRAS